MPESYADMAMLLLGQYSEKQYDEVFPNAAQYDIEPYVYEEDNYMIARKTFAHVVENMKEKGDWEEVLSNGKLKERGEEEYNCMAHQLEMTFDTDCGIGKQGNLAEEKLWLTGIFLIRPAGKTHISMQSSHRPASAVS